MVMLRKEGSEGEGGKEGGRKTNRWLLKQIFCRMALPLHICFNYAPHKSFSFCPGSYKY